jgi:superfamily II DNA helicase RecQ
MKADTIHISVSPDRPNIFLYKLKVDGNLTQTFQSLVELVMVQGKLTPKTLVYCKSQKECGKLFKHFKCELGEYAYYPAGAPKSSAYMLIGMYHANTLDKHKDRVSNSLFEENGTCRVVFATTALGMGVNLPDVQKVIHYGPPRHVEEFMQEMGRAGRNGNPAESILYITGRHLRKCEEAIKKYATCNDVCLRQILLERFCEQPDINRNMHNCCVVCHQQCRCDDPSCYKYIRPKESNVVSQRNERFVEKYQKADLLELLQEYQKKLESQCPAYLFSYETTTGFSDSLIKSVLETCKYIFTVDDIFELNPVFTKKHAIDILCMVSDVFNDIEQHPKQTDYLYNEELFDNYDLEYGGSYMNDSESSSDDGSASHISSDSSISGINEM